MKISRPRAFTLGLAVLVVVGSTIAGALPATASEHNSEITTVIRGLNSPRGIAFDGRGDLYVSQSGAAGSGPAGLTRTGRVTKYRRGGPVALWTTTFESFYTKEDPASPPDVLGPEGISATGSNCGGRGDDRREHGAQCAVMMIMSESHAGIAAASNNAIQTKNAGHLYSLNPATGKATSKSNVGDQQYRFTKAHKNLFPPDFPDSNPYGVLVTPGKNHGSLRTFVADAGANTISEIMPGGRTRIIAYIPNETAAPFRDATPTCIAQGPDGWLYVATLHLVANIVVFGSGQSDVWRVNPNANYPTAPKVWAKGLTTPTACTFDRRGNFWATEMFQPTKSTPGDVVRIPFEHPSRLTRIGGGKLPLPGGIAQAPNGDMYVSINSASPKKGSGAIVRIDD